MVEFYERSFYKYSRRLSLVTLSLALWLLLIAGIAGGLLWRHYLESLTRTPLLDAFAAVALVGVMALLLLTALYFYRARHIDRLRHIEQSLIARQQMVLGNGPTDD